jgi:hypothetical protein
VAEGRGGAAEEEEEEDESQLDDKVEIVESIFFLM